MSGVMEALSSSVKDGGLGVVRAQGDVLTTKVDE